MDDVAMRWHMTMLMMVMMVMMLMMLLFLLWTSQPIDMHACIVVDMYSTLSNASGTERRSDDGRERRRGR